MNFSSCILLGLAGFTLVGCNVISVNTSSYDQIKDSADVVVTDFSGDCTAKFLVQKLLEQERSLTLCQEKLKEKSESKEKEKCPQSSNTECVSVVSRMFYPPKEHNSTKYYLSTFAPKSIEDANTYCLALGGYLAEIDDRSELAALQDFIMSSNCDVVFIAGSNAARNGKWIFPRTGKEMQIFDWMNGEPNNLGGVEDCLNLWKTYNAKMNDVICVYDSQFTNFYQAQFLCEVNKHKK